MNEADNLKSIFANLNRAAFARDHKFPGGQSMIYQHITGRKPISLECAVAYSIGLQRPLSEISPRIAEIIARLPSVTSNQESVKSVKTLSNHVSEPGTNVYTINPTDAPEVTEIAEISRGLDDVGRGMLLQSARAVAKEREAAHKVNTVISST